MKLIDVSVPLDAAFPPIPNNTPFSLEPMKRVARGESSNVSTLHMSAHAGTHVDAPRHFFDDGSGSEALPLEMLIGRTRVVEVARAGISADDLSAIDLCEDVRVLIKTHNSRLWGSPEFHPDYVGVTESGASTSSSTASRSSASTISRSSSSGRPARRPTTCCSAPA